MKAENRRRIKKDAEANIYKGGATLYALCPIIIIIIVVVVAAADDDDYTSESNFYLYKPTNFLETNYGLVL